MIKISFDDGDIMELEEGTTLEQLSRFRILDRPPVAALVNGSLQELDYPLFIDSRVQWLDHNSNMG